MFVDLLWEKNTAECLTDLTASEQGVSLLEVVGAQYSEVLVELPREAKATGNHMRGEELGFSTSCN
jgi:hypothetical protein